MSDPGPSWSDQPNAPQISRRAHRAESAMFATTLIDMTSYGIIVVLFSQCMTALLNPAKPREGGTRWLLVVHTVATFSITTVYSALDFYTQTISFVDNRNFPSSDVSPAGPLGYLRFISPTPIYLVMSSPLVLVGLLADGLLLYRCHVICAMNFWVTAFPSLMYLASVGMGIMYIWQFSHPFGTFWADTTLNFGLIYLSISVSLNVILTLIIVIRLVKHNRMVLGSIGALSTTNRLYKFIVVVLVESCALYTLSSVAYLGPWSLASYISDYLYAIVSGAQVIAPFLVTLRMANRTALTSHSFIGSASMHFIKGGEQSMETAADENTVGSVDREENAYDGTAAGVENDFKGI